MQRASNISTSMNKYLTWESSIQFKHIDTTIFRAHLGPNTSHSTHAALLHHQEILCIAFSQPPMEIPKRLIPGVAAAAMAMARHHQKLSGRAIPNSCEQMSQYRYVPIGVPIGVPICPIGFLLFF